MAYRSTKAEYARRLEFIQKVGHLFEKRSELVKYVMTEFGISSVSARAYVREAFPSGLIKESEVCRDILEGSTEIFYYLAKVTQYVNDKTTLNQLLRFHFKIDSNTAETCLTEFKQSSSMWGKESAKLNKRARDNAYQFCTKKRNDGEWPSPSLFLCTDCDKRAEHYHHPNYAYPHWVEPVCSTCHTRIHTILYQRLLD